MSYTTSSSESLSGHATLTAFFDSQHDAERAVSRLRDAGIPESGIRLVPGYENDSQPAGKEVHQGFFESLANFFMPAEDRYSYAEGLRRGGFLVTVNGLSSADRERAIDILDDEGTVDFDQREESWRSEGWSGYDSNAYVGATDYAADSTRTTSGTGYASTGTSSLGTEEVIPVVEEELRIGKRDVSGGRVRVRSYVHETPISENVTLRDERVHIERRPVDRALNAGDAAFQDRTLEAEEVSEEAVVSKQARVVEEISLRKDVEQHQETVSDTVRRTEVEVEDDRGITSTDRSGTFNRR